MTAALKERVEAQTLLAESERRLATLMANLPGLAYRCINDACWTMKFISDGCLELTGYPPEALVDNRRVRYADLIHPDDRQPVWNRIQGCLVKQAPFTITYRLVTASGVEKWVLEKGQGIFSDAGDLLAIEGFITDITDRARAEQALRESEQRYRQIVECSSDPILVRHAGRITYANPAALRMFEADRAGDLVGKEYLELVHPDDRAESVARIRRGEAEKWVAPIREHRITTVKGNVVHVESTGVPIDFDGRTHVYGIFRDITDRKRLEARRKELEDQLRQAQKMEAIGVLAGGIAHDFNNILAIIIGYTEMAMLNDTTQGCTGELQEALKAALRAKDLIKQILAFSRQADPEKVPTRVAGVALEAVKFLRATTPATIEIRPEVDSRSGCVLGSWVQVHQIVLNLCTNAVHAIGAGTGVITVGVKDVDLAGDHAPHPAELEPGSYVRLSVADTGRGMASDTVVRIFDPYYTTKEMGSGTGLGLAVVHGIVQNLGGAIRVESHPGHGSIFDVYLPKARIDAGAADSSAPEVSGGCERILFVDDEAALTAVAKRSLESLGYRVTTRTSPVEAVELFRSAPDDFDLVISDQTMPGMTGEMLAREVMRIRPNTPIVICTGYSQTLDPERAAEIGIKGFVMKPLLVNEISRVIRQALLPGRPGRCAEERTSPA